MPRCTAAERNGFKVGDIVIFTAPIDPDGGVTYGQTGVVCSLGNHYGANNISVEWDLEKQKYHNCAGTCRDNHGWWVPFDMIAHVSEDMGEITPSDLSISSLFEI